MLRFALQKSLIGEPWTVVKVSTLMDHELIASREEGTQVLVSTLDDACASAGERFAENPTEQKTGEPFPSDSVALPSVAASAN